MGNESPSCPETARYRHKKALHWSAVHNVSEAQKGSIDGGRQVCLTEGLEACRTVSAYYIGRISRKQAYAVLLHMYTAMYGGRMLNAAPEPVLPMVIA